LQLFLIALFSKYTSWSAEPDSNARGKSTGVLPTERMYFACFCRTSSIERIRIIFGLAAVQPLAADEGYTSPFRI
jgi:hypothetical protein